MLRRINQGETFGAERVVRKELADGDKLFFEGEHGEERVVRFESKDGATLFYEGEKGAERLVRAECIDSILD